MGQLRSRVQSLLLASQNCLVNGNVDYFSGKWKSEINGKCNLKSQRCTGVHWFANELIKAIVLSEINQFNTRHTPRQRVHLQTSNICISVHILIWTFWTPKILTSQHKQIQSISGTMFLIDLTVYNLWIPQPPAYFSTTSRCKSAHKSGYSFP